MEKFLIVTIIIQLFLFTNVVSVYAEQPVIASRIAVISEISIIIYSNANYDPNSSLFSINTMVEILNRDDKNQTVTELADCYPKVQIIASFANQSLGIVPIRICLDMGTYYSYPPGITKEYETIMFYINQTGLTQLPDGNYTLGRPINTASSLGYVDPAEVLLTNISVNADIMNIAYPNFTNITNYTIPENHNTDEVSFPLAISLVIISLITYTINIFKRRRTKI